MLVLLSFRNTEQIKNRTLWDFLGHFDFLNSQLQCSISQVASYDVNYIFTYFCFRNLLIIKLLPAVLNAFLTSIRISIFQIPFLAFTRIITVSIGFTVVLPLLNPNYASEITHFSSNSALNLLFIRYSNTFPNISIMQIGM